MDPDPSARPMIGRLLRLVYQHYSQDVEAALREAGFDDIAPAAANVFPLVPLEGISVSELADLARVRKQTMTQAVSQLERTGYLERRPNPRDLRSRLVFLTDRGTSVRPVTHAAATHVEASWAKVTSTEELENLRAALQHLLAKLSEPEGKRSPS